MHVKISFIYVLVYFNYCAHCEALKYRLLKRAWEREERGRGRRRRTKLRGEHRLKGDLGGLA